MILLLTALMFQVRGTAKIARQLGFDYAEAVVSLLLDIRENHDVEVQLYIID